MTHLWYIGPFALASLIGTGLALHYRRCEYAAACAFSTGMWFMAFLDVVL